MIIKADDVLYLYTRELLYNTFMLIIPRPINYLLLYKICLIIYGENRSLFCTLFFNLINLILLNKDKLLTRD